MSIDPIDDYYDIKALQNRITELEKDLAFKEKRSGWADALIMEKDNRIQAQHRRIEELETGIQDYLNAEDVSIEMEMRRQLRDLLNQPGETEKGGDVK